MKLKEAKEILSAIVQLQNSDAARKPKFAYFLAKNRRILDQVEKDFQEAIKDDESQNLIVAFEREKISLMTSLATKSEDGNPVIVDGNFTFSDESEALAQLHKLIEEKYPTIEQVLQERANKFLELGEKEDDINLVTLAVSEWPELPNTISPYLMDVLYPLMSE